MNAKLVVQRLSIIALAPLVPFIVLGIWVIKLMARLCILGFILYYVVTSD